MRNLAFCLVALSSVVACGAVTGLRDVDAGPAVDVGVDRPDVTALRPFERCTPQDVCGEGSTCLPALFPATSAPVRFCTFNCASALGCPSEATHSSMAVVCATILDAGVRGQCYETCTLDVQCGRGTRCVLDSTSSVMVCLPVAGTP